MVPKLGGVLPKPDYAKLHGAGAALARFVDLIDSAPKHISPLTLLHLYDAAERHVILSRDGGVHMKPKHHLFLHLMARAAEFGNPNSYSTFDDESINRNLKQVGVMAQFKVWTARALVSFERIERQRAQRKRHREP